MKKRQVEFTSPSRSLNEVIKHFDKYQLPCSNFEAEEFIYNGILKLDSNCFSETKLQWDNPPDLVDVYGLQLDNENWYVKFSIGQDENGEYLDEISFHPLEKDMKLANGKILKGIKK